MNVYYDDLGLLKWDTRKTLYFEGQKIVKGRVPELDLSKSYTVTDYRGKSYPVIYRGIVHTEWFAKTFDAQDVELGSHVQGNQTVFRVWAPTANSVKLVMQTGNYEMRRQANGVYEISIDRNCHNERYNYEVSVNGEVNLTTDIYAKASTANAAQSVVVDWDMMRLEIADFKQPDPIILETHVRDFSMDPNIPFKNRGKFLGMLESHGQAGMAHILDLGVTNIQIMPINDFGSVDETQPLKNYNWGYDPMQYMSLEGSYNSKIEEPLQAIRDFAQLVDSYHKANIGVNVDVVFNHVYEVAPSAFHQTVPYYYFRYKKNYEMYNGTFCGNEVASERTMVRKMIVDACAYFVETFHIDGYRFDLMGIMDIETMNTIRKRIPNVMLYGEGWHMKCGLKPEDQASIPNADKLPGIGFFNDQFRNSLGGDLDAKQLGYVETKLNKKMRLSLEGSPQLFQEASQSVNYVECHDNYALADKVAIRGLDAEVIDSLNALVVLSKGIPFMQIGQSFFRNKHKEHNSYNLPDTVNRIEWEFLETYQERHQAVKKFIEFRKKHTDYEISTKQSEIRFTSGDTHIVVNPKSVIFTK